MIRLQFDTDGLSPLAGYECLALFNTWNMTHSGKKWKYSIMAEDNKASTEEEINLRGNIIEIRVGEDEEQFYVHSSIICRRSEFFRTATKKEWDYLRPYEKFIDLTDDEPEIFNIYLAWLYTGTLPTISQPTVQYTDLAKAYVLGEKLLDPIFKKDVLDGIISRARINNNYPSDIDIKIIYEGTPESSPARHLMVDFWTWIAFAEWKPSDNLPKDFLLHALQAMQTNRPSIYNSSSNPPPWL